MSAPADRSTTIWVWSFVALMALAVFWPGPVVAIGHLTVGVPGDLGGDSFLGHESPRWDVAFWAIAGLYFIALVVPRTDAIVGWKEEWVAALRSAPSRIARRWRAKRRSDLVLAAASGALVVALVALLVDERFVVALTSVDTAPFYAPFHYANILAGGGNPWFVIAWFFVAALALERRRWLSMSVAMAFSGALGGVLVQLLKHTVRRARPELWIGAFIRTDAAGPSFPSGHTMAAFVIGGVIFFGSESRIARALALIVALLVASARIVSYRHWPSDVVASALIGGALARFFTRALLDGGGWLDRESDIS